MDEATRVRGHELATELLMYLEKIQVSESEALRALWHASEQLKATRAQLLPQVEISARALLTRVFRDEVSTLDDWHANAVLTFLAARCWTVEGLSPLFVVLAALKSLEEAEGRTNEEPKR